MDLQGAFRARLLANGGLSSASGGRITWGSRPQAAALPAVVLTKVAPGRGWTHDGPDPLVNPWLQVDFWGKTQAEVAALSAVFQTEMEWPTEVTAGGWIFLPPGLLVSEQWPGPEDLEGGGQAYRIIQDYRFWARPA